MGPALLCEDDEDIRLLVTLVLESAGLAVTATAGVAQAMEALARSTYPLVLTDLGLPDGDGSTVGQEARSAGSRVIVLTARTDATFDPEINAWAEHVLAKPFTPAALIAAVGS